MATFLLQSSNCWEAAGSRALSGPALVALLWGPGLLHGSSSQTAPSPGARRLSWGGAPEDWGWSGRRIPRKGYMGKLDGWPWPC